MTAPPEDRPAVLVHPPVLFLIVLAAGLALEFFRPTAVLPGGWRWAVGALLILGGGALMTVCLRLMKRAGTTHKVQEAATAIVSAGPFARSRNPLYVSLVLVYLGAGAAADSLWVLGLAVPFTAALHWGVVLREEQYLEAKFGEAYLRYKASVRRWL